MYGAGVHHDGMRDVKRRTLSGRLCVREDKLVVNSIAKGLWTRMLLEIRERESRGVACGPCAYKSQDSVSRKKEKERAD